MTLVGLIAIVVLIALLIYIAQQMAPPWPFVLYAIAALLVVVAILLVLGIGGRTIAIGATPGGIVENIS